MSGGTTYFQPILDGFLEELEIEKKAAARRRWKVVRAKLFTQCLQRGAYVRHIELISGGDYSGTDEPVTAQPIIRFP